MNTTQIEQLIAQSDQWPHTCEILTNIPSIGAVMTGILLASLPELGQVQSSLRAHAHRLGSGWLEIPAHPTFRTQTRTSGPQRYVKLS